MTVWMHKGKKEYGMKKILISLMLLCNGCAHKYTRDDAIKINRNIIMREQAFCADAICEASENISRPEVVMRLLEKSLNNRWEREDVDYYLTYDDEWSE